MKKPSIRSPFTQAQIDLGALRSNYRAIRAMLPDKKTEILAVVKADAYGHGMKQVARVLCSEGVHFFGVATLEEAKELRKICPREHILVLGSFHTDEAGDFIRLNITPTISSIEDVRAIDVEARHCFPIHVKIDTGMGRLGVWHRDVKKLFGAIKTMKHISVEGVYTHFSSADKKDGHFSRRQIQYFEEGIAQVRCMGFKPRYLHAANSMGLCRFGPSHFNLVRPGIILYGVDPAPGHRLSKKLKPVMTLKTRISFLKKVGPGRTLSYGATHITRTSTRIATLPVGYSHGYRIDFSNKARVSIRGRLCPVVGRVTMDQTLVDVGLKTPVKRWDEVTLIGRDRSACIRVEELARMAGTIPYEILCSVHSRIPRVYKGLR